MQNAMHQMWIGTANKITNKKTVRAYTRICTQTHTQTASRPEEIECRRTVYV